ncbi:response regulator transcription factor [Ezakiella coagulans]|nr:helix-turn-helix transcriptional regulator [Ezakiella coagulans]
MLGSVKSTEFTHREIQVLRLLTIGEGNEEITAKLKISQNTIKTHIKHLLKKRVSKAVPNLRYSRE